MIATGTPAGVGPMQPGDTVEVEVSGIGILCNTIVWRGRRTLRGGLRRFSLSFSWKFAIIDTIFVLGGGRLGSISDFLNNMDWWGLLTLLISAAAALLCITLHELSHGFVAWRLGDPTAKMPGG